MAVGSDEQTHVTDAVVDHVRNVGVHVELHGPLADPPLNWVDVGREVGERVTSGACEQGGSRPGPTRRSAPRSPRSRVLRLPPRRLGGRTEWR